MVDESALAADLHDGQPLAVPSLQRGVVGDVHLDELEPELVARPHQDVTRPVAETAAGRVVERDDRTRDTGRASLSPRRRA